MLSTQVAKTIEIFLKEKLKNINFDEIFWSDYDNTCAEFIRENVSNCVSVRSGASKCVLFFKELTNLGFCVKIPFLGFEDEDDDGEYYRDTFYCANHLFGTYSGFREETSEWDYCNVETFIGKLAEDWEIENFFARTYYLCEINHHPVYIAEQVDNTMSVPCDAYRSPTYNFSREIAKNMNNYLLDIEALSFFVDNYGEHNTIRFLTFLDHFNIGDLYGANIGFRNGQIKLIDYSDFND